MHLFIESSLGEVETFRRLARRVVGITVVEVEANARAIVTANAAQALAAAKREVDVLLVGPLSVPAAERSGMAESGRVTPFRPSLEGAAVRRISEICAAGTIGRVAMLRIHHWTATGDEPDELMAGELDLACGLGGLIPQVVYGRRQEGYLQAHLGFSTGAMAVIDVQADAPLSTDYYSIQLIGSDGAAESDDRHDAHWRMRKSGTEPLIERRSEQAIIQGLSRFAAAANGDGTASARAQWCGVERSIRLANAVSESASKGVPIEIDAARMGDAE